VDEISGLFKTEPKELLVLKSAWRMHGCNAAVTKTLKTKKLRSD